MGKQSPSAVRACKRLIQGARHGSPQHHLAAEREAFIDLFDTADRSEGVLAFLEKRPPQWKNG
ncbi:MAG: enoyl-CoA hydratase-related protein [Tepidimonas sp.]|uniref:enoyl-CoA hydratase-related protein n=1 Tax=Tepidimonas sp. TaxID=2002775 RepID=UPI004054D508